MRAVILLAESKAEVRRDALADKQGAIHVSLEVGRSRVFASAVDWPGWCRSGRDEGAALDELRAYGSRYAKVLKGSRLGFKAPSSSTVFSVVERLKGDSTTDYGAPGMPLAADARPLGRSDLARLEAILKASWRTFDAAVAHAEGVELTKGPRGGGRDLDHIVEHVMGADQAYLGRIGCKSAKPADKGLELSSLRAEMFKGLEASAHGKLPSAGPRGGRYWTARYFVRRAVWHVLDHAWEIETRSRSAS